MPVLIPAVIDWLDTPCVIQRPTLESFTQDKTWSDLATVDCNIRALNGDETLNNGSIESNSTHRVVMETTDVVEGDRLSIGGRLYNVRFVDEKYNEADNFLQIDAQYIGVAQ